MEEIVDGVGGAFRARWADGELGVVVLLLSLLLLVVVMLVVMLVVMVVVVVECSSARTADQSASFSEI